MKAVTGSVERCPGPGAVVTVVSRSSCCDDRDDCV